MKPKRTYFSPSEDQYIRDNYLTMPKRIMAVNMGRSRAGLRTRIIFLGLTLPEHIKAERASMSHFKQGHVSFNTGKKQSEYTSPEAIERSAATRFSKGNIPKNSYREIGKITIRPDKNKKLYKFICVELGNWQPLHRHTWEQHNGPIPKKHVVWFKDKDPMNCDITNLECIPMAECMRRNSASLNLPDAMIATHLSKVGHQTDQELKTNILNDHPDLITAKRTQLLINRKIKQLTNTNYGA